MTPSIEEQSKAEIVIWYRWCELDKVHEYSIVCKEGFHPTLAYSYNCWIFWLWYRMGEQFTKIEKKQFKILPFSNSWDKNSKVIKMYKTCNTGVDRVIPAIRKHYNTQTKHIKP